MIINRTLIYDVNSMDEAYLINIKNGAKCTIHGKYACPDEITDGDVERALEKDGINISKFVQKKRNLSIEALLKFRDCAEEYISLLNLS
jgi:hypothetical protein